MLEELPRHQRAQRNPEQHQHGLRENRRHRKRPSQHHGNAHRHHRARDQSSRQAEQKKQNAADRADRERFNDLEGPGAAGKSMRHRCKRPVSDIRILLRRVHLRMSETKDTRKIHDSSGVSDLTFAFGRCGRLISEGQIHFNRIWLMPPYGKSVRSAQLRRRGCTNARRKG